MNSRHAWWCVAVLALAGCGPQEGLDAPELTATQSQELVVCAAGTTVEGIDVSIYQGTIDWAKVKGAGKKFAIARIGDGTYRDPTFAGHWAAIKQQGMIRGAYQFFRPGVDPIVQANIVIAAVGRLGPGDLPVTIDLEAGGTLPAPATYNRLVHQWMDKVEQGTGKRPMLYVGKYYWPNINTGDFAADPLWHPQYTTASCPNISNFWSSWKFWQYRGGPVSGIPGGTCAGISGYVDLNHFNGSLTQLQAFAGQQTCTPHCEGSVMVGADCGRGDCGAFGSTCVKDTLGLRCVFSACPATGEKDVCLDDAHVAHCKNGQLGAPGDCSAYAGRCSTANAPTGARCVSAFCASSMTEVPQPAQNCWPEQPARIAKCDANGAFTLSPCATGEQCSVVGGAHCEPKTCPDAGTVDVCAGALVTHCVEGQVVSAIDCAMSSGTCTDTGGVARCASNDCVVDGGVTAPHTTCLPTGWLGSCDGDGQLANAAPCEAGSSCVAGEGGAACVPDAVPVTPMDPGGVMGQSNQEPPPPEGTTSLQPSMVKGGCAAAPTELLLALGLLLLRRRAR